MFTMIFDYPSALSLQNESGRGLSPVDLELAPESSVAVTEDPECGADELCQLIAQQLQPQTGSGSWAGHDWFALPASFRGDHIAYVGKEPWLFDMSLLENVRYGCFEEPDPTDDDKARDLAERSGNTRLKSDDPWFADSPDAYERLHASLLASGATDELIEMGMRMPLTATVSDDFQRALLALREPIADALRAEQLDTHVQRYDPGAFIDEFSIGENLLFAVATEARDWTDEASEGAWVDALTRAGLLNELLDIGVAANREFVEMFAELPDNHRFFSDLGLFDARDLPDMQRVAQRVDRLGTGQWVSADRWRILSLVLSLKPAKHRVVTIALETQARIVQARATLQSLVQQDGFADLEPLDPAACCDGLSVFQNAVFGVLKGQDQSAHRRVRESVLRSLQDAGLERPVVDHALSTQPGPGGRALRPALRQKLALARALTKPCTWLIVNRALDALDPDSEAKVIEQVLRVKSDASVLWSPVHASNASMFSTHVHLSASGEHSIQTPTDGQQ
ncbi:MAG: hypothetical protein AAF499_03835 [Pseudomonadota bacterium]